MWQQLVTAAAQQGAGLLATVMVQRLSGMRHAAMEWHKSTKSLTMWKLKWHIHIRGLVNCVIEYSAGEDIFHGSI